MIVRFSLNKEAEEVSYSFARQPAQDSILTRAVADVPQDTLTDSYVVQKAIFDQMVEDWASDKYGIAPGP